MKKELLEVIKGLELVVAGLRLCIEQSGETQSVQVEEKLEQKVEEPAGVITLEEVRAVLAAKAQAGMQPQVKELITKYGGKKLTDLEPSCYAELLQEAQVL